MGPRGLAFLKAWEALRLDAYPDLAGVPTIGYGTTRYEDGSPVRMGDTITEARADQLLLWECGGIDRRLDTLLSKPVTASARDALVCFCYNVGTPAFATSTLRRMINNGSPIGGPDLAAQFLRWNKAHVDGKLVAVRGLTRRRRAEAALFATDGNDAPTE
jgi:lysozyme